MIAMVVSAIANIPAVAAPPLSRGRPSRSIAAVVEALIHRNLAQAQIVTFADPRLAPVRVVRGGTGRAAAPIPPTTVIPMRWSVSKTVELVAFAEPGEQPVTVLRGSPSTATSAASFTPPMNDALGLFAAASEADLDRIVFAVDGAESSHGSDPAMWRPDLDGPEGPMQVTRAAAIDSGGGDRFDLMQNRRLGRAYLALLYRRYGNWPDAVAAYNWGPGNLDAWIESGRPPSGLPLEVERYRDSVLREGGMPHSRREGARAPISFRP